MSLEEGVSVALRLFKGFEETAISGPDLGVVRRAIPLSQKELGKECGLSRSQVDRMEKGVVSDPQARDAYLGLLVRHLCQRAA